eukprot:TRINITY_DN14627_c0_g1_i2.p1 TRINITY_DN14627_c0_g1~~TRINITY_DN14627_c0_g1_i2.p1  ORF type:complete len:466 (-),score=141.60 TRINITY_DN14627_c0_g1_i2:192-1589(-)
MCIRDRKGHLSEREAAVIMRKIFSAVHHLHEIRICHRDLKPENILFLDRNPDAEIKIIDFGLSKKFGDNNQAKDLTTMVGTALYVAPEVLKGKYDERCDNWSLGVILYILLSGNPPFYGDNNQEIFKKVIAGKYSLNIPEFKNVSKLAKDLIQKLLVTDPSKRLTAKQALSHPWIMKEAQLSDQPLGNLDPKIINMLRNFRSVAKFKKEALRVVVNLMSENEIKNLREAFRLMDKDNSGIISLDELRRAMQETGCAATEEEIQKMLKTIHVDNQMGINYTEFLTATLDRKLYLTKEKLWTAFKYFDVDNSNFITVKNLREAMARAGRKLNDNELQEMIAEIDRTKEGRISFEEFGEMMRLDKEEYELASEFANESKRASSTMLATEEREREPLTLLQVPKRGAVLALGGRLSDIREEEEKIRESGDESVKRIENDTVTRSPPQTRVTQTRVQPNTDRQPQPLQAI